MSIKFVKHENNLQISVQRDLQDIRILRHCVEVWLKGLKDISTYKILAVKLCLEELVYNAILHAYPDKEKDEKIADINIQRINDNIEITVDDYGTKEWYKDYKSLTDNDKNNEILGEHGRGLMIINSLSQELTIQNTENNGTQVHVTININNEDIR